MMAIVANYTEVIAMLLGMAYILLAAKHQRSAWLAAMLCSGLYAYLLWQDNLPMQALLNAFYVLIAIIGWYAWRNKSDEHKTQIRSMSLREHLIFIALGIIISLPLIWLTSTQGLSQSPWLDTSTSVFSVLTTLLLVKERIENWLYWILIDGISTVLFIQTEHWGLTALYLSYSLVAIYGYLQWKKIMSNTYTK
jgi:nicotinamide mononucleotide transporter